MLNIIIATIVLIIIVVSLTIYTAKQEKARTIARRQKAAEIKNKVETRIWASQVSGMRAAWNVINGLDATTKELEENLQRAEWALERSKSKVRRMEDALETAARKTAQQELKQALVERTFKGFRPLEVLKAKEKEISLCKENKIGVYEDVEFYFAEAAEVASKGEYRSFLYFPSNRRKINGVKWNHYYLPTWASKAVAEEWKKLYCH